MKDNFENIVLVLSSIVARSVHGGEEGCRFLKLVQEKNSCNGLCSLCVFDSNSEQIISE
jgi:hypothetical protein